MAHHSTDPSEVLKAYQHRVVSIFFSIIPILPQYCPNTWGFPKIRVIRELESELAVKEKTSNLSQDAVVRLGFRV